MPMADRHHQQEAQEPFYRIQTLVDATSPMNPHDGSGLTAWQEGPHISRNVANFSMPLYTPPIKSLPPCSWCFVILFVFDTYRLYDV